MTSLSFRPGKETLKTEFRPLRRSYFIICQEPQQQATQSRFLFENLRDANLKLRCSFNNRHIRVCRLFLYNYVSPTLKLEILHVAHKDNLRLSYISHNNHHISVRDSATGLSVRRTLFSVRCDLNL